MGKTTREDQQGTPLTPELVEYFDQLHAIAKERREEAIREMMEKPEETEEEKRAAEERRKAQAENAARLRKPPYGFTPHTWKKFKEAVYNERIGNNPFEAAPDAAREIIKRDLATKKGKTKAGLAKALGVSRPTLDKRIEATGKLTYNEANITAWYLGYSDFIELLTGEEINDFDNSLTLAMDFDPANPDGETCRKEARRYTRILQLFASLPPDLQNEAETCLASLFLASLPSGSMPVSGSMEVDARSLEANRMWREGNSRLLACLPEYIPRHHERGTLEALLRGLGEYRKQCRLL